MIARDGTEREDYLAGLAHDLRCPLATVNWHIQRVRRRAAEGQPPSQGEVLELLDLIEDTLTSVSAQIAEMDHSPTRLIDLVELTRKVLARFQDNPNGVHLQFESTSRRTMGTWWPQYLERVVSNLLSNAVNYSPAGGDVRVRVTRAGGYATVCVEDRGLGVPAEDLPHIFERYWRGSNVRSFYEGSGLGLATARDIAEELGGTLTIESQEGRGTRATLVLPTGA